MQQSKLLLAKNTALNLSGQVLLSVIAVASLPWVVKAVKADAFGILSIAWMLLSYSNIFDLGIGQATVRCLALCSTAERQDEFVGIVWTSAALQSAIGFAAVVVLAPFAPYAATHWFKIPTSLSAEAKFSLLALTVCLPVLLLGNALRSVLQAVQRFDIINAVRIPTSGLMFIVAAVMASCGARVSAIVFASIVVRCLATIAFAVSCLRLFPSLWRPRFSQATMRRLLSFGGCVAISNTAGPVITYIERFLIAGCLSVSMVGFYSAPFDLTSKVLILPASLAPVLYPVLAIGAAGGEYAASRTMEKATSWLLFFVSPICAVMVAFAGPILQLWLGPEFAAQSGGVMRILTLVFFCNAIGQVLYVAVMSSGRPEWKVAFDVVSVPLFALLCWRFLNIWGVEGAALAKLALTVLDCAFLFVVCLRLKALRPQHVSGHLVSAVVVGLLLLLLAYAIGQSRSALPIKFVLFATSVAGYAVTFWKLALDEGDRAAFKRFPSQVLGRMKLVTGITGQAVPNVGH